MIHIFHKWDKWEQYKERYKWSPGLIFSKEIQKEVYKGCDIRQRRICIICGKMQDKLIKEN